MIFISHATADSALAKRIAESLEKKGFDVWQEDKYVLPGDNWADNYADALRKSDAMIVLLTPDSVNSKSVISDAAFALGQKDYKNRVIPVIAAPRDKLPREKIPWILKTFHLIDLPAYSQEEEGFVEIAELLKNTPYNTF